MAVSKYQTGSAAFAPELALRCERPSRWRQTARRGRALQATAVDEPAPTTMRGTPHRCRRSEQPRPKMPISLRAPAQQDNLDGLEHDEQIQSEGGILDVKQVILQLFPRILHRVSVPVPHLRPARNAGTYDMPDTVVGNLFAQPLDELGTFRARTNEVHITLQNAPQLRDLV